ncbi:hypothetical protein CYY_005603 [Polysphondylium violaceum]|uniref:Uncharacterized protein n=1 Tax=Polysphondylium violaceum TaxID=133409 RepID=A0A8J4PTC3_9MYCE|nr:hypothetical protein CYY_005603 [Polysphondylium violaceum]
MVELYDSFGIKIYVDHNRTTSKVIDLQKKLFKIFLSRKVPHSLISIFDIAYHFDIQKRIKAHSQKIPRYPYIEINGKLWGEGDMVESRIEEIDVLIKELVNRKVESTANEKSLVDAFLSDTEPTDIESKPNLEIGYIDSSLNLIEWLSYGIVSNIWNPWRLPSEPVIPQDSADIEFEVVRTNWYGRHQYRTYRFTPSEIYRIHNNTVKATLFYKDIQLLTKVDSKNIIIKILNCEDQYIQAVEEDISKIIEVVTSRAYLVPFGENEWKSSVALN